MVTSEAGQPGTEAGQQSETDARQHGTETSQHGTKTSQHGTDSGHLVHDTSQLVSEASAGSGAQMCQLLLATDLGNNPLWNSTPYCFHHWAVSRKVLDRVKKQNNVTWFEYLYLLVICCCATLIFYLFYRPGSAAHVFVSGGHLQALSLLTKLLFLFLFWSLLFPR